MCPVPLCLGSVTLVFILWRQEIAWSLSVAIKSLCRLSEWGKIYSIVLNDLRGQEEGGFDLKLTPLSVKLTRSRIVMD